MFDVIRVKQERLVIYERIDKLETDIDLLKGTSLTTAEMDEINQKLASVSEKYNKLEADIKTVKETSSTVADTDQLKQELLSISEKINNLESDITEFKDLSSECDINGDGNADTNDIVTFKENILSLTETIAKLKSDVISLQERINNIENNNHLAGPVCAYYCPDNQRIAYDVSAGIITFPANAIVYDGKPFSMSDTITVNLPTVQGNAWTLRYDIDNQTIIAMAWNSSDKYEYPVIGYIYRNNVVVFGCHESNIQVITKTISFFGDSITAGVGANNLYHMNLSKYCKTIKCLNWGVGGTGFVCDYSGDGTEGRGVEGNGSSLVSEGNNTVLKVMQGTSFSDCVICAGTNDWSANIELSAFRTAVQNTLDYAISNASNGCILVITPFKRYSVSDVNGLNLSLHDYSEVIIEECELRAIPYIDGYNISMDPNVEYSKEKFMPDGIHPNNAGHVKIAEHCLSLFKEAMCI